MSVIGYTHIDNTILYGFWRNDDAGNINEKQKCSPVEC